MISRMEITGKAHNIAYIKKLNTSFTFRILEHHLELLHILLNPVLMNPDNSRRFCNSSFRGGFTPP